MFRTPKTPDSNVKSLVETNMEMPEGQTPKKRREDAQGKGSPIFPSRPCDKTAPGTSHDLGPSSRMALRIRSQGQASTAGFQKGKKAIYLYILGIWKMKRYGVYFHRWDHRVKKTYGERQQRLPNTMLRGNTGKSQLCSYSADWNSPDLRPWRCSL